MKRLPLIPTLMTVIMVGFMVWAGFWQLQRREWKHDLIARLQAAQTLPPVTTYSSPSRVAVVRSDARSEPASGSLKS